MGQEVRRIGVICLTAQLNMPVNRWLGQYRQYRADRKRVEKALRLAARRAHANESD